MANTTSALADFFQAKPFLAQYVLRTAQTSKFFSSGIIQGSNVLDQLAKGAGKTFSMPFINDLSGDSNVSSDSTENVATPKKITGSDDTAIKHMRNNGWTESRLLAALTDPKDPLGSLINLVGDYWARELDKIAIASAIGILVDNEASPSGTEHVKSDLVTDVRNKTTDGSPIKAEDNWLTFDVLTDAMTQRPSFFDEQSTLGVHPVVYSNLVKAQRIQSIPDAQTGLPVAYLDGKVRILMLNSAGSSELAGSGTYGVSTNERTRAEYVSILFGNGVFGYGEGVPDLAVEFESNPAQGNGEGVKTFWSRKHFILHPFGTSFTNSSVSGKSPTNTELKNAANWKRAYGEREQIRLSYIRSNG